MTGTEAARALTVLAAERWLPVAGWEGRYEVSDLGHVRRLRHTRIDKNGVVRTIKEKILKGGQDSLGYLSYGIAKPGTDSTNRVYGIRAHVLVLETFVGPRPPGAEGCHNDGDPTNNRLSNLRWDSRSENQLDRVRHGTHNHAKRECCAQGHRFGGPNAVPSETRRSSRGCLACSRATSWLRRHPGDLQAVSDAYYREIIAETKARRASQIHTLRDAIARLTYDPSPQAQVLLEEFWEAIADVALGVDEPFVDVEVAVAERLLAEGIAA